MHADVLPPTPPQKSPPQWVLILKDQEWPTLSLLAGCVALWAGALFLPLGFAPLQWVILVLALTLHSSLSHEILHGHPFRSDRWGTLLGVVQPGLFVPYLRFKALHLAHHHDATLTDPYDDPESNYLDPDVWERLSRWHQWLLMVNNTLLGRMLVGPVLGMAAFIRDDWHRYDAGEKRVLGHWLAHLPGVALTVWAVTASQVSWLTYLLACYGALSVLRIRTFLEHRAHVRAGGRSVIIEDRGVLAFLFLNNNLHAVHHMHPKLPWYLLPSLYRERKARFLQINQGYVYPSYGAVFASFFLRRKDPVAHPLWRGRRK